MVRIGKRAVELDQHRLQADPKLQRCLAWAAGVEIGAGSEDQRLAGVNALAAAENCGEALLWAQLVLALAAPRSRRRAGVDRLRFGEPSGGDLFAAAMADAHRRRSVGTKLGPPRIGAGYRLGMQGAVEQAKGVVYRGVDRVFLRERLLEPALSGGGGVEWLLGPNNGDPRQRQLCWSRAGFSLLGPAPPSGRRWRSVGFDDEHALTLLAAAAVACQVATIRHAYRAWELELHESEVLLQKPDSPRLQD